MLSFFIKSPKTAAFYHAARSRIKKEKLPLAGSSSVDEAESPVWLRAKFSFAISL
jgi:hypothetical protein